MGKQKISKGIILKLFDWVYARSISGIGCLDSAYELGDEYLKTNGNISNQVDRLIRWQSTKAATNGFLTGVGGLAFMPFALPANIAGVTYVQMRMIAAIAYMGGHDIRSDRVKSLIYICMVGNSANEVVKDFGIKVGERLAIDVLKNASKKTAGIVKEKIGTGIITRLGTKGLNNLTKVVPVIGGIIGAGIDASATQIIGKIAKKVFIEKDN